MQFCGCCLVVQKTWVLHYSIGILVNNSQWGYKRRTKGGFWFEYSKTSGIKNEQSIMKDV